MSLHIVRCKNCNIDRHAIGAITVQIHLSKSNHCSECHHSHEDKHSYYFCSPACMTTWLMSHGNEFMVDVAKMRAGKMYDRTFNPPPDSGVNPPVEPWPDPVICENAHPPKVSEEDVGAWKELYKPEVMRSHPPIKVPPIDIEKVAEELKRRLPEVQAELKRLEEAKKVSPETWYKVVGSVLKKPEEFFTNPKPSTLLKEVQEKILEDHPCCPSHCCTEHGCKYSDDECPVVLGICEGVRCEYCGLEEEGYYDHPSPDTEDPEKYIPPDQREAWRNRMRELERWGEDEEITS